MGFLAAFGSQNAQGNISEWFNLHNTQPFLPETIGLRDVIVFVVVVVVGICCIPCNLLFCYLVPNP